MDHYSGRLSGSGPGPSQPVVPLIFDSDDETP